MKSYCLPAPGHTIDNLNRCALDWRWFSWLTLVESVAGFVNKAGISAITSQQEWLVFCDNHRAFYERNLRFHVLLAEKTGNPMLVQAIKRVILPLFAFIVMRVHGSRDKENWIRSLERHRRIIDAIRTRNPVYAERLVIQTINAFFGETQEVVNLPGLALQSSKQRSLGTEEEQVAGEGTAAV
jgi:hypothetical protein